MCVWLQPLGHTSSLAWPLQVFVNYSRGPGSTNQITNNEALALVTSGFVLKRNKASYQNFLLCSQHTEGREALQCYTHSPPHFSTEQRDPRSRTIPRSKDFTEKEGIIMESQETHFTTHFGTSSLLLTSSSTWPLQIAVKNLHVVLLQQIKHIFFH